MGAFSVKFGIDSTYKDPDYRYIGVKVVGETEVACDDLDGSERGQTIVKNITSQAITDVLSALSKENISYKNLITHQDRFTSAVRELYASKNITLTSFSLTNIVPDENSSKIISQMDQMNAISRMTPEELAKLQQEKMAEAQRAWDALSPEEKARIEAENKLKAQQAEEQMRKAREFAMKASSGNEAVANAAAQVAAMNAMKAGTPVMSVPKFCSNCGTPTGGTGKFCGSCGAKLV
ncbi:MAG: hypothetical protein IJ757_07240 [Clostridiales bacterium]|nr:hypothetical protein [Clostridiales bacterium]